MRAIILSAIVIQVLSSCTGNPAPARIKQIGLQPIGAYDQKQLVFIQHELSRFFRTQIAILPVMNMPESWQDMSKGERYSADSIIAHLKYKTNDTIGQVVGVTNKDIYTTYKDQSGQIRKPEYKYAVWGIMGLGFCPGKACVVSNFRLMTGDDKRFARRLRTVVIHEAGHNLGLPHCPHDSCIMNDAYGSVKTIDNSSDNYCSSCRNRLRLQ